MRRQVIGVFVVLQITVMSMGSFESLDVLGPSVRKLRRTYCQYLGPRQGWHMFSGVRSHSDRTEIWALRGGSWHLLYAERSDEATWNRRAFDHYRWRQAFVLLGKDETPKLWKRAVGWIAARAFEDSPETEAVRVQRTRAAMLSPEALRSGETKRFDEVLMTLEVTR